MSRLSVRFGVAAMMLCLALGVSAAAQDFQKNYQINPNGYISIGNISGDVKVTGYNGGDVIVTAYKEGRDRDAVEIEDRSDASGVEVRVRYPRNCNNCDASVRFEVQVPRGVAYRLDKISSVSGDVEVSGVTGEVNASTVSGDVRVGEVNGVVNASSVSGDVHVNIEQLEGLSDMKFSSVSGDVEVSLPGSLDADISMSSLSGTLTTDFPIEIKESKHGPGRSARGRVGAGSRNLRMSSVSGSLSLKRL